MKIPRLRPRPARHPGHVRGARRLVLAAAAASLLAGPAPLAPGLAGGWLTPAPASAATCPASLQALIDGTPSGGTLNVPACVYRESVTIRRAITLNAAGATVDGENRRSTGVTVTGDGVTIDGLTVTRIASESHTGAVNVQGADRFTFRNGVARDSATVCLGLHGASNARVQGSELTGCGKEGYFLNNVRDSAFVGNRIHHNNMNLAADWFVEAGGGKTMASTRITFDGNEVAFNRGPGIWFDVGASDATVTRNRVHDNDREGIFFEVSSGADISGNAVWGNGFAFHPWGWGAGISVSSSDGARVADNVVAWNARGISVISQARELSPHDHDTVTGNMIVAASGDRLAGFYDDHGGSLFAVANANGGSANRYWSKVGEPSDYRFEWNGDCRTLACYNATRAEEGGTYLTIAQRDAALSAAGVPLEDGTVLAPPAPLAGDPRITIAGGTLATSGVRARISWTPIGVANAYRVQLQRDSGSWATLKLASPRSTSVGATLATGHTWRARLALRTPPGTWSAWAASARVDPGRAQETSGRLDYAGGWRRVSSPGASGGEVRYARASGATATFTFTGRAVAWVAPVGPTRGSARVYVDGVYRTTVNLHRSSFAARRIVFRASWAGAGTHEVTIRVAGSGGHPRVDVDAFAILR